MTTKIAAFSALKIPLFRKYLFGAFISETGNQMQTVAVAWQVYQLTHNPASLGLIGLANFLPIIFFSLIGGVVVDKIDRKRVLLISQICLTILAFILLSVTILHIVNPWIIYTILIFSAIANSFSLPARQAVLPNLVPKEYFMNAVSLNTLQFQSATMIGPAVAGFLIGGFGVWAVYLFNALSFFAFIWTLIKIKVSMGTQTRPAELNLDSMLEGIKFVASTPILYLTMILDFLATFFGTATILMPVFASDVLHVGPQELGFLYAAPAVGGVVAGLLISAFHNRIKNQGKIILVSVIIYGLATIGFGFSKFFPLSLVFLIISGFGDMVSAIIRNTVRQMITPDHLRGRMSSIMRIFFQGGPQLGEIEAGLLAATIGGPACVVLGGIGTVLITGFIGIVSPKLRNYQGKEVGV